jgi:hypothetical protein
LGLGLIFNPTNNFYALLKPEFSRIEKEELYRLLMIGSYLTISTGQVALSATLELTLPRA